MPWAMFIVVSPKPPLAERVQCLWYFAAQPGAPRRERALPTGTAQIIVNLHRDRVHWYDGPGYDRAHTLPGAIVAGPSVRHFGIDTGDQIETIGVSFRAGGAARIFGGSVGELRDAHVALQDVWGREALWLRERLLEVPEPTAKLRVLEAVLIARLGDRVDPAIAFAAELLARHGARVSDVFSRIGWSASRLSRSFTEAVGITPKLFARVQRLRRPPATSLGELAAECGYFDHAHFVHDFQDFAGLSPSAYLAADVEHANHVPLD
jgi:AraC-like DNA-binding protein